MPLPDRAAVCACRFEAPGCTGYLSSERREIDRSIAFLDEHMSEWQNATANRYGEFLVSLDVVKAKPVEFRAGRSQEAAFLQTTATDNGVLVREITESDLASLLELCKCDLTIAFLQVDKGFYKGVINNVLAQRTRISAKDVDKTMIRRFLGSILDYSRSTPQDTDTSLVLRRLDSLAVNDFVPGSYAIDLTGCGNHCFAHMIVSKGGEAMPATPQNCLSLCRDNFGDLNTKENVRKLSAKVIEGSHLGEMIGIKQTSRRCVEGLFAAIIASDQHTETAFNLSKLPMLA